MVRSLFQGIIVLACAALAGAAQEQAPPKELIQYIRDAQKAGQNVFQIQENAVNSGWPMPTVTEAIAFVRDQDGTKQAAAAPGKAESKELTSPVKPEAAPVEGTAPPAAVPAPAGGTPPAVAPAAGDKPGDIKPADGTKTPSEVLGAKPEKASRGVPDDYQFGAGDSLEISVWKEPEASVRGVVVRTDGKISMPLLHEVDVVGLTPVQLEKLITDKLASGGLINTPEVTIIVTGTASKKIYVQGKVKKEGPIPFTYRMNVLQALSEAGGITDYAKKNKIFVMRTENGKAYKYPFDYTAVLKGQRLELNIQLQAGDMIVVP